MPCSSWSLPATACHTGSKLAAIKGSVCHNCYARKGNYNFPSVKNSRQANLDNLPGAGESWETWIDSMSNLIDDANWSGFFRWFDSGDIQNKEHLEAIAQVAERLPHIEFWLPTKEYKLVSAYTGIIPDNLIIRVSSPMIDQKPLKGYQFTSTVYKDTDPFGFICKAPEQGDKCKACRACWDKTNTNISYKQH
jgi:hypothetical protein